MSAVKTALSQGPCSSMLTLSSRYLGEYLEKIRRGVDLLSDDQIWWRPSQGNSVGNLLLHLAGNLSLWIRNGIGNEEYERDRAGEFAADRIRGGLELVENLAEVVGRCQEILEALDDSELSRRVTIQTYEIDVLGAVYHAVEHMSYHTGQILFVAKHLAGPDREIEFYPRHRGE